MLNYRHFTGEGKTAEHTAQTYDLTANTHPASEPLGIILRFWVVSRRFVVGSPVELNDHENRGGGEEVTQHNHGARRDGRDMKVLTRAIWSRYAPSHA